MTISARRAMVFAVRDVIPFLTDRRGEGTYLLPTEAWVTLYFWGVDVRGVASKDASTEYARRTSSVQYAVFALSVCASRLNGRGVPSAARDLGVRILSMVHAYALLAVGYRLMAHPTLLGALSIHW